MSIIVKHITDFKIQTVIKLSGQLSNVVFSPHFSSSGYMYMTKFLQKVQAAFKSFHENIPELF